MNALIGLLIIALGAFCQSSSYVPINKVREWSWESYWLVQGVFAWLLFPLMGALLAVPEGHSLCELLAATPSFSLWMTMLFGILWGVGGLTFGLSMRYLGVALGQSVALGTCAALGTIMGPVLLNIFFPEMNALESLTASVLLGVVVTLIGIAIIGMAGAMRSKENSPKTPSNSPLKGEDNDSLPLREGRGGSFYSGLLVALLAGFMSGCFNVGLTFGKDINFGELTDPMFRALPATLLVTLGGFLTNAAYCLWQNGRNRTWGDYGRTAVWLNNLLFCLLAGALWYSQFFGLSLGRAFFDAGGTLDVLSFCILMALNVVFSNVWGVVLGEWKGCSRKTVTVLVCGIIVLIVSTFVPQLLK